MAEKDTKKKKSTEKKKTTVKKTTKEKKQPKKITAKKKVSKKTAKKTLKKSNKTKQAGTLKKTKADKKATRLKKTSAEDSKERPKKKASTPEEITAPITKPVIAPEKKAAFDLAQRIGQLMLEKKAEEIMILDVGKLTGVMDYFVIASGSADIHIKAITDHVLDTLEKEGQKAHHVEGRELHKWVLIDFIDVVVHIFDRDTRSYYNLERLWGDAPSIPVQDDFVK